MIVDTVSPQSLFVATLDGQDEHDLKKFLFDGMQDTEIAIKLPKEVTDLKKIHLWELPTSSKNLSLWNMIKKGDWCIFSLNKRYILAGKLVYKLQKKGHFTLIKNMTKFGKNELVMFFAKISPINLGFSGTNRELGFSSTFTKMHKINFLKCDDEPVAKLIRKYGSLEAFLQITPKNKQVSYKKSINYLPKDVEEPPKQVRVDLLRKIRDTVKTKKMKKIYDNRCQICNVSLRISDNANYSEVHHVWPLGEGGIDDFDNMVVLCPNHHAQFDFASIGFDNKNPEIIIDMYGNPIGKISFKKIHRLKTENVVHHAKKMRMIWD